MFGLRTTKKPPAVLGLDIRDDVIHAVQLSISNETVEILSHISEPIVASGANPRDTQLATLRKLVTDHGLAGHRTVLSTTAPDVVGAFAERLPSARGIDMRQWALTQLEGRLKGGTQGNYVADAAISRVEGERVIAYVRRSDLDPRVAMAKEAGLEVIAFDAPIMAWQRRYGMHFGENFDGLLDVDERPTLYLFREPVGHVQVFGQIRGDALASAVRAHMVEMRKADPNLTINRICVHGKGNQRPLVDALRAVDRAVEFEQIALETDEGTIDPPWAFAAALATWDAPNAVGTRVNLLTADRRGYVAFGRTFSKADLIPGFAAIAAAAVIVIGGEIGYSTAVDNVDQQDALVNSQIAVATVRSQHIALIQNAVERLRMIDRDRFWLDRSGRIVALRMVDLANAIPPSTTISRLSHDPRSGWRVTGASRSLSPIAQTQDALAKASPGQNVTMIREAQTGDTYGFDLSIAGPTLPTTPATNGTAALGAVHGGGQ